MTDDSDAALPPAAADGARRTLLAVLLAACALLKLLHAPPAGYYGPDGSTYFQIARHVQEGDGLLTSVSLYNQGLKSLPAPTTVYPLWPLTLGLAARPLGLDRAARLLPELLYLVDLLLLYLLANRLARAWSSGRVRVLEGWPLDAGHVAVLLLGLNPIFFRYSSLPYTEPLALGLAFAALLVAPRAGARHSTARAIAAGVLAGAAYLARTPMIAVPAAIVATLALDVARAGPGGRAHAARTLAGATVGVVAVVAPWIAFLASFVRELHPLMLIDVFTLHRETPELAPVRWIVPPASLAALVAEVWTGLRVAFAPRGPSYVDSFGPAAWVVPVAVLALVASRSLRRAFAASADQGVLISTALAGVGLAVMAQAAHSESDFARLWAFDHRQGLPFVVAIVAALACVPGASRAVRSAPGAPLVRAGGVLAAFRVATLLLVGASLVLAVWHVPSLLAPRGRGPTGTERELVRWLDAQPRSPVVIARRASRLAVLSRAGFHWIGCGDDAEQTRRLFVHAGAELLVVRRSDRRCAFMRGLEPELERVETFRGDGPVLDVYRFRGAPLSAATS